MKYILWEISYTNLAVLTSSIPSYDPDKKKTKDLEIKDINEIKGFL